MSYFILDQKHDGQTLDNFRSTRSNPNIGRGVLAILTQGLPTKDHVMTKRNIHGLWSMRFEKRILHSTLAGPTNKEASEAWLEDIKTLILTSQDSDLKPWVLFFDLRSWDMTSLDAWEANDDNMKWISSHSCTFFAFLLSKEVQHYAIKKGLQDQSFCRFFFNYEEAYQACLDKLTEAQNQQSK